MTLLLELVGVGVLILLNGFFVAAEYALVTVRRTRVQELADEGNRRARAVQRITTDPPHFIAAMQLGVTLTSLAIGALGEPVLSHLLDDWLGRVLCGSARVPHHHVHARRRRRARAEGARAQLLRADRARRLRTGAGVLLRLQAADLDPAAVERGGPARDRASILRAADAQPHSEAELKMLLEVSHEHGEIEHDEREMLYKVFDFADKEASDVMVPRPEVVGLSIEMAPEEALAAMLDSPYTRYPVYRESLDEIVGDPARARPRLGAPRPRHRRGRARRAAAPGVRRSRDEGPGRAARRVPAHEPAHGGRRRRVRRDRRGSSRSRTCSRRSSARSRTSSTCRTSRSSASTRRRSGSTARSRSTTSTRSSARRSSTRTTTPSPATSSTCSAGPPSRATRCGRTACASACSRPRDRRIQRLEVEFLPEPESAPGPTKSRPT